MSGFLANGHLPRVSRQSRMSANYKDDDEMIPGLCTDLLAFTLQVRKTRENFSKETLHEGCAISHRLKWGPLDRIARQEEKWKEKRGCIIVTSCPGRHWAAAKESFKLVCRCQQLLSGFLTKDHLPRVSSQLHLSANDKDGNEMIPGLCTDLLAFALS